MTTATLSPPTRTGNAPGRRGRAFPIVATLAVLAVAASLFTIASLALFTDSATVGGNAFTTGTVDIATSPATAAVTASGMAPGDQVTAPLTVNNNGTLQLRYAITSTTTEDVLASQLALTIKSGVTTCDDANWAATGTVLYNGALGSVGTTNVLGSSAAGADPGDRTLAAAASEVLCINVTLPLASSNAFQGTATTATVSFVAEQTANNP